MTRSVVIHANAGEDVGLGHLVRCATLARELQSRDVAVRFRIKADDDAAVFLRDEGIEPVISAPESLGSDLQSSPADVAVLDSYELTTADFERIGAEKTLVVVDELGDRRIPADLVLNNNLYANDICYPEADAVLRGPEFCMLREPYRTLPEPTYADKPERVLLTVGGADLSNAFRDVLGVTAQVTPVETTIDTVVGPYFDKPASVPANVEFHHTPENMHELMWRADLAVSGGGQTLYELAACGTPPAAVTLGPDQERNIEAFTERGFCHSVGEYRDGFGERLRTALLDPLDYDRRRRMGETGRDIVDSRGVVRVADRLLAL